VARASPGKVRKAYLLRQLRNVCELERNKIIERVRAAPAGPDSKGVKSAELRWRSTVTRLRVTAVPACRCPASRRSTESRVRAFADLRETGLSGNATGEVYQSFYEAF
jgi:hypothetical protein